MWGCRTFSSSGWLKHQSFSTMCLLAHFNPLRWFRPFDLPDLFQTGVTFVIDLPLASDVLHQSEMISIPSET